MLPPVYPVQVTPVPLRTSLLSPPLPCPPPAAGPAHSQRHRPRNSRQCSHIYPACTQRRRPSNSRQCRRICS